LCLTILIVVLSEATEAARGNALLYVPYESRLRIIEAVRLRSQEHQF